MSEQRSHPALLPTGLADLLPPDADAASAAAERALSVFRADGYLLTAPPMLEFEESFLSGAGAPLQRETFRMMDPASQRMLALRSDVTPQIARIAATRLAKAPRPLRLCYMGMVLRVSAGQLGADRQFRQAGAELIGSRRPEADAEIVLLAAHALAAIGVEGVSVDLNVPRMAGDIAVECGLDPAALPDVLEALDRKDMAETARLAPAAACDLLQALIDAGGPAEGALEAAAQLALPAAAAERVARLHSIADLIRAGAPDLALTIDFVEHRGFDYHTGVAFSLFAKGHAGELGRGGRYRAAAPDGGGSEGEPAVGFSLFMEAAGAAARPAERPKRIYVPHDAPAGRAAAHAEGHVAVAGLEPVADSAAEARRLECDGLWSDGAIEFFRKDD